MENLVFLVIPALLVYICLVIHLSNRGNLGLMSMYLQSSHDGSDVVGFANNNNVQTIASASTIDSLIIEQQVMESEPVMIRSQA